MALFGGTWIWGAVVQHGYEIDTPTLDWADSGFGRGWAFYIMMQVNFALAYNYGYWLAGYVARGPAEIVRLTSTVRAVEAAGGAVASGLSSTSAPLIAALGVNFGLWGLAVVPTYFVARKVGVTDEGESQNPAVENRSMLPVLKSDRVINSGVVAHLPPACWISAIGGLAA
ncbi:hypothetical protein BDV19DRAFT_393937 [Aspergillus venezuelensis]